MERGCESRVEGERLARVLERVPAVFPEGVPGERHGSTGVRRHHAGIAVVVDTCLNKKAHIYITRYHNSKKRKDV
jgi:hypothetical protein